MLPHRWSCCWSTGTETCWVRVKGGAATCLQQTAFSAADLRRAAHLPVSAHFTNLAALASTGLGDAVASAPTQWMSAFGLMYKDALVDFQSISRSALVAAGKLKTGCAALA